MPRSAATKVRAKELSPALRRRLGVVPEDEVSIVVTKQRKKSKGKRSVKDLWIAFRGTLSDEAAADMIRAIHENRRSKTNTPSID